MKKFFVAILIILTVFCFNNCSYSKPTDTPTSFVEESQFAVFEEENKSAAVLENPLADLPDAEIEKLNSICRKYGATGASVALIDNKSLCSVYCYGVANKSEDISVCEDTKYRVASLSKLVTDIIFLKLTDMGLVDPHINIENYLGYNVRNPYYRDQIITAHMLMTHTSSIVDSQIFLNSRLSGSSVQMSDLLSNNSSFSLNKPGDNYIYSNFGIAIIGAICEKVTGKCFDDIAHEVIFTPLDIDAGYIASSIRNKSLIGELYGYGGLTVQNQLDISFSNMLGKTHHIVQGNLTISAKDYAKIICLLLNDGKDFCGNEIISSESVKKIIASQYKSSNNEVGYGIEIQKNVIDGEKIYVHTGSNYGMFAAYAFSDDGTGIVVLTSGAEGTKDNQTGIYQICLEIIRCLMS